MSNLLPLASYNLELKPFFPQPCQAEDFPITVRITLASIDPQSNDEKKEPSTLRILKQSPVFEGDEDSEDECDDSDCEGHGDEEDDEEEEEEKKSAEESEESEEEDDEDMEDDDEELDDEGVEEHVICTLSPESQYQQSLDLTILPDEKVFFVVTGSYTVHLTGNYVEHPNDDDEDDFVYGSDGEDSEEYDLTPDEDEIIDGEIDYDLDDLDNVEDVESKITELIEEDLKRQAEEAADAETEKPTKKAKKETKKEKKEKSVKFNKELEQGPTGPAAKEEEKKEEKAEKPAKKEAKKETKKETKPKEEKKKPAVKTLPGGVIVEDKTVGTGPVAKRGQKVGVRYIGKLKNGKVFDKNTSGRPFNFGLGKGEVIKGWDVGVAGMAVGGERRIVIPAAMAYGSQKLPGIPANSELTFDVKLLSIK
jgi:FK506-binding nuclear protein